MEHETQMMDLFEATQKMGYFNESDARTILKQVYQGTTHCLSVGILHRDIKDENVLVNIQTREVCNNCCLQELFKKNRKFETFQNFPTFRKKVRSKPLLMFWTVIGKTFSIFRKLTYKIFPVCFRLISKN